MMHADFRPLLAPHAHIKADDGRLSVDSGEVSVDYAGHGAHHVREIIASLDGRLSLAELAHRHGIGERDVGALLAPLFEESLLLDTAIEAHEYASSLDFQEAFRHECRFWSRHIFARKFWTDLRSGAAPHSTVMGWGIEFYHYVKYADEYMAAGVAYCGDSWVTRQWVAKHFVEEAGHGEIFLEGLVACGLSRSRVETAPPLPATRALMNTLMESALEGALAYTACFGLTQPEHTSPTEADQDRFYDGLLAHYPGARGLIEAFSRHARIDVKLHHDRTTIERVLEAGGGADRSGRAAIIRSVRRLAENFVVFFDQISDYYASPSAPIPRRAPGILELYRT